MFRSAALGVVLVAVLQSSAAWAQACCAGSTSITPARLTPHEDAAVGIQLHATTVTGSFNAARSFISAPSQSRELGFQQDLAGTLRVLERGQVTLLAPIVETWRNAGGLSEVGGGLGDINLSARYDFIGAGQKVYLPGIAVLLGVTLPTGRTPESARQPLATDATGIGAFQGTAGVALEQSFGHILVNLTGLVTQRAPRNVGGVSQTLGLQIAGLAAVGYVFNNEGALSLSLAYNHEGDSVLNGQWLDATGRAHTTLTFAGAIPIGHDWRVQGGLFDDLSARGLGRNQPVNLGFTFTLMRTWS